MKTKTNPNKIILFSKHIHSCCASFSSSDSYGHVLTTAGELDFKLIKGKIITSKKFPTLNGETIENFEGDDLFMYISTKADKTFYNKALKERKTFNHYNDTEEYKELIKFYKLVCGWDFAKTDTFPGVQEYSARCKERDKKARYKKGLVLAMGYDEYKGHPEYFQGGFSDGVFNSPELQSYIDDGSSVYGWIGDSSTRKSWHDTLIEDGLRERGISDSGMYNWLSSSDGRHFADSLEGYTDSEQRDKIKKYLNTIFNKIIIYNFPRHAGTSGDSKNIESYFKDKNVFLLSSGIYSHNGPHKLLNYAMAVTSDKSFSKDELKQLLSIISLDVLDCSDIINNIHEEQNNL